MKTTILTYNQTEPSFYYHSDHLGSASFLTDETGAETQQLVYLPFGEDWVDKKYNNPKFQTPYKFNGKEKDPETGYNYFGARYYTDWASIWLSVDPMSDKYPHLTSYNYCANNPVMLIDPDGKEGWPITRQWEQSDIKGFAQFSQSKLKEYKDQKLKDDCANFALRLIVGYASENGLPLILENSAGKTFDASSDKYKNREDYLNDVRASIQARDIPLNTYDINQSETQAGDMEVMKYTINNGKKVNFNHVVIFTSPDKITWGNLMSDGSGAELSKITINWVRSSKYNDGIKNKFTIYSGMFNSRWKMLNPLNMKNSSTDNNSDNN